MSHAKEVAKRLFFAALDAVRPENVLPRCVRIEGDNLVVQEERYPLPEGGRLYLLGSGKASIPMAGAIDTILQERYERGVVVSNYSEQLPAKIRLIESCHPYPCARSIEAARALASMLEAMRSEDLFCYLLSGGSSALIEDPIAPVRLEELAETTRLLLSRSVPIEKVNCVRKHLSRIKGGKLAQKSSARGIVLVVSDVVGDDLEAIGSAPLYRDRTTREEAIGVLKEAQIWDLVPEAVRTVLSDPRCETPKEAKNTIRHHIVANNKKALEAAARAAEAMGLEARIVTDGVQGDVRDVARMIVERIDAAEVADRPLCLLFGGEPTVEVVGEGVGGRNQELCLRVLERIKNRPKITFLSGATDGIDGNSDAAGGVVEATEYDASLARFLADSDAYHYLDPRGALIKTGPTGTNVMDIMIAIKGG